MSESTQQTPFDGSEIAVIGLAGRFPGARTIDAFWQNVRDGVESITVFSDDQLIAAGVNPALFARPDYVRAGVVLEDADKFDAFFFGFSPREAEILDPQHRLFLECAWEALETAGYDPGSTDASIGVFAGTGRNAYYEHNLLGNAEVMKDGGGFEASLGNTSDFLATRVAYKLNLKGPSLSIQTSCSTSLVAVHVACQHLVLHQCDLALAGGVFLGRLPAAGYLHQPGGIVSSDGHCRAFDAKADGAVSGRGAGVVVLKRLRDALRDGDTIRAVVRGSAVNNDGSNKVSYSAPSVGGQSEVIAEAIAVAGVPAESIGLVEAHGTGTPLGDPAEIAALTKVYRAETDRRSFCAIGSLKTNLGHMDVAAGIAGMMKAVLALEHRQLPPSLHFTKPNPEIDFADSPFFVNTTLRPWATNGHPRRAAVSSFGIGGTNAHVILEEAPKAEARQTSGHPQALILSARTREALETATDNLAGYLEDHPDADLADVAFTLQTGRRSFEHRRAVVCGNAAEAIEALRSRDGGRVVTSLVNGTRPSVVFVRAAGNEDAAGVRTFAELLEEAGIHPAAVVEEEALEIALARYPGHIAVPMTSGDSGKPLLDAIVRLWTSGADVIWPALHAGQNRRRIPLPTYPFARQRFWIEPRSIESTRARQRRGGKIPDLAQWFHRPVWKQAHPLAPARAVDRIHRHLEAAASLARSSSRARSATIPCRSSTCARATGSVASATIVSNCRSSAKAISSGSSGRSAVGHRTRSTSCISRA
jgi:acyl transferase domain-containing protein